MGWGWGLIGSAAFGTHLIGAFARHRATASMHLWAVGVGVAAYIAIWLPLLLLQLSTKLLDKGDLRDSLKLVYDFNNRFGE